MLTVKGGFSDIRRHKSQKNAQKKYATSQRRHNMYTNVQGIWARGLLVAMAMGVIGLAEGGNP